MPAVEEVVQCNAEEKHLKSSELDSRVEMGTDSTPDSDDVELENQQTDSSNKTMQAMEKKGRQVDKNLTQSEKENTQSDYKIDSEPDNGTVRDGHETGDVNGNTTYRKGDRARNMAVDGDAIQDHSEQDKMMSEKGQQEQHELSKALAKDHSELSMPPDKDHSEPSMPPDKNHSEPSMPPDNHHSEPSMPPEKDHSEPTTTLDKDHSKQSIIGTEKMSSGSEGKREDKTAQEKHSANEGGRRDDDKTQTETPTNGHSAEHDGDKQTSHQQNSQQDSRRDHSKVINKKKTQEENLINPSTRPKAPRNQQKQNLENVTVHFYVVVSHDFKLDHTDMVTVRFDTKWSEGGGWECKKHTLLEERKLADGHLLFGISLEIPKRHLRASPGLQYKYAILKSGRKGKLLWEYLDKRNYFLKKFGENRILHVPLGRLNALKGEICHQYDGMINNKTDSGMVATVKNWWDNTKEQRLHEMAIATCAFLPKLDSICIDTNLDSAEQALKQIVDISSCMEQCDATHNNGDEAGGPYTRGHRTFGKYWSRTKTRDVTQFGWCRPNFGRRGTDQSETATGRFRSCSPQVGGARLGTEQEPSRIGRELPSISPYKD
ncbi:hypothetical protein NP493_621g02021 [Ridgeia piscesae]|uniref:Uncharacterized protein n=1 Tax=Ridgeia piscesae TaxID=27915 RepID=A0AAD9KSV8_RIDPI|nr:hypothetical protein NP493_621g02021 [Ridgeia piscesae]